MPRRLLLAAVAAAGVALAPAPAAAHPGDEGEAVRAALVDPRADSVVTEPVRTVSVTFNSRISPTPGGHELVVLGPDGDRIPTGPLTLPDNGTLRVTVPGLDDRGRYRVQYTVAAQGHLSMGEHAFTYDGPVPGEGPPVAAWAGGSGAAVAVGLAALALRRRRVGA